VVALDAMTGKMRWSFQMVHHDIFDYDVAAAPALIEVMQNGKKRSAVAEITKSGLLFILDRMTGKPIFGVEERPTPRSDVPGEQSWPTQPFPLKPPPLARNRITPEEISSLSPESRKFCRELLQAYPNSGPYTPFQGSGSTLFPSTMGGGNWGGMAFDANLGYVFVNTSSFGSIGKMVKSVPGASATRAAEVMPYRNEGGYARFVDQNRYPCNQPPWGELIAVNANTGDIAWRVALGSYQELEGRGMAQTGAPNIGGPIVTAGGLLFIGGTNDGRFRAFDARTGKPLWQTDLVSPGESTPITYLGRDGKQYVVIATGSAGHLRSVGPPRGDIDTLAAFALQD
jgi:glucose dehydrogenase